MQSSPILQATILVILCQLDPDGKIKGPSHHGTTVILVHQRSLPHAVFFTINI